MSDVTVYFNKNRRVLCSAKESSVLSKRVDDAKRKQSIYSQNSLNCYAVEGSNTGQIHSKLIVVSLGFHETFSLLPFCLCGFIWSNTIEMGGFGKNTCFSDEIQCPYEGSVDNGGTLVENGEDICRKALFWLPGRYQQRG